MDRTELSEIRARLREAAEREGRPRRPLLSPFRPASRPAPSPAPAIAARRVGLNQNHFEDDIFVLPGPAETGRGAFGQRTEPRPQPAPTLMLPAPEPALEPEPEPKRWSTMLAPRPKPAAAPAETPYHPEDFSDHAPGGAERLYAAAGLSQPAGTETPRPWLRAVREAAAPAPSPDPQHELLSHLERVFLAEMAGLEARRL